MNEVEPADPDARRRALWTIAAVTVLGATWLTFAPPSPETLATWIDGDGPATRTRRLAILRWTVPALLAGSVLAAAAWLWRLGARIVRSNRVPPAGVRVVRDTPVLSGDEARRRGRLLQALAVMLVAIAGLMAVVLWRLLILIGTSAGAQVS
jgi:hypothetical protein